MTENKQWLREKIEEIVCQACNDCIDNSKPCEMKDRLVDAITTYIESLENTQPNKGGK